MFIYQRVEKNNLSPDCPWRRKIYSRRKESLPEIGDGLLIFKNAVEYVR